MDETLEEKLKTQAQKDRERELSDIRVILQSPEGRRFYWRVMEEGNAFRDAYSVDTNSTFYNLGRQAISRYFLNELLESKPTALSQMQQERESESKSRENKRKDELKEQSIIG